MTFRPVTHTQPLSDLARDRACESGHHEIEHLTGRTGSVMGRITSVRASDRRHMIGHESGYHEYLPRPEATI